MRTNLIKKKEAPKVGEKSVDGMLDMVIAFDTTGSMSSYIEAVRRHVIDKETGERLVNINTISQLIYNGTKYIVD